MSARLQRTDLTRDELARRLIAVENRMKAKPAQAKVATLHVETTLSNRDLATLLRDFVARIGDVSKIRQVQMQRIEPAPHVGK